MAKRASIALSGMRRSTQENVGLDVLGLATPAPPQSVGPPVTRNHSSRDGDDLSTIDLDMDTDFTPLISSHGITSAVLREDADEPLDWAAELLLLTHEPLRRDMLEMQRALQPNFFGELPDGWRVRAFFRFFGAWSSLVSQQHAVEIAVHYDWLAAPTHKLKGEHRSEVLSYHRKVELELLAISRLENKILSELAGAAEWTSADPWSECSQTLRQRLAKLCGEIRMHLATQESVLPEILREHWGRVSPPQLVTRSLDAAKRAQADGAKAHGREDAKLLMWVEHYLHRRSPQRAKALVGSLPFFKRVSIGFGRRIPHSKLLANLQCIIDDRDPQVVEKPRNQHARHRKDVDQNEESDLGSAPTRDSGSGADHERQRKAGMVSAVLAAANARRVDVPLSGASVHAQLAQHDEPLHTFKADGNWVKDKVRVPDNLHKRIGVDKATLDAPRRL